MFLNLKWSIFSYWWNIQKAKILFLKAPLICIFAHHFKPLWSRLKYAKHFSIFLKVKDIK